MLKTEERCLLKQIFEKKEELNTEIVESNFDLSDKTVQDFSSALEKLLTLFYKTASTEN